jgi:two-component system, cell cycle response regulator DivK
MKEEGMTTPHILIIDDNKNNQEVLAGLLERENITATAVGDPTKVIDVLDTLPRLDAVFIDLEMPKMNGYELLEALRARLGHSVPMITYTVHLSEMEMARRLGFDGFLGKPIDPERFPKLIARILQGLSIWELP